MTDASQTNGMTADRDKVATPLQAGSLLALRVTVGFLIIWWGLAKAMNPGLGNAVSNHFYGGVFSFEMLQLGFGVFQVVIGGLVVLGLFRAVTFPVQLLINAFRVVVWSAIIFVRLVPGQRLSMPSSLSVRDRGRACVV